MIIDTCTACGMSVFHRQESLFEGSSSKIAVAVEHSAPCGQICIGGALIHPLPETLHYSACPTCAAYDAPQAKAE